MFAGRHIDALYADVLYTGTPVNAIKPPSVTEVKKLICSMPAKSSPMDSIPTSIHKILYRCACTADHTLVTLLFRDGVFPSRYKIASITPALKKKDADRDNPANFRPISNLHRISKQQERIFLSRIVQHVEQS